MPKNVRIVFSGFCEPFANPQAIDMIEYASKQNYKIQLYTTLYQTPFSTIEKLTKISFEEFILHLPDCKNMIIQKTEDYLNNIFSILTGIPNISTMIMNEKFFIEPRVEFNELNYPKKIFHKCSFHSTPAFVLLPNCELQLCCRDFCLSAKIGNLLKEEYVNIKTRFLKNPKNFKLCQGCPFYLSMRKRLYNKSYDGLKWVTSLVGS